MSMQIMARCINESCQRPLRSLSDGRLFQFEIVAISLAANDEAKAPFDEKPQRQTVHFWLCGACASTMTLVLEPARGLKVVPVQEQASSAPDFLQVLPETMSVRRC